MAVANGAGKQPRARFAPTRPCAPRGWAAPRLSAFVALAATALWTAALPVHTQNGGIIADDPLCGQWLQQVSFAFDPDEDEVDTEDVANPQECVWLCLDSDDGCNAVVFDHTTKECVLVSVSGDTPLIANPAVSSMRLDCERLTPAIVDPWQCGQWISDMDFDVPSTSTVEVKDEVSCFHACAEQRNICSAATFDTAAKTCSFKQPEPDALPDEAPGLATIRLNCTKPAADTCGHWFPQGAWSGTAYHEDVTDTRAQCAQLCILDSECSSVTFAPATGLCVLQSAPADGAAVLKDIAGSSTVQLRCKATEPDFCGEWIQGMEFEGQELMSWPFIGTKEECLMRCHFTLGCSAVVYTVQRACRLLHLQQGDLWLQIPRPQFSSSTRRIDCVTPGARLAVVANSTWQQPYDYVGYDMSLKEGLSIEQCADACSAAGACNAATFTGGACALKHIPDGYLPTPSPADVFSINMQPTVETMQLVSLTPPSCGRWNQREMFLAHNFRTLLLDSKEACAQTCNRTRDCAAVSFVRGSCSLLEFGFESLPDTADVSSDFYSMRLKCKPDAPRPTHVLASKGQQPPKGCTGCSWACGDACPEFSTLDSCPAAVFSPDSFQALTANSSAVSTPVPMLNQGFTIGLRMHVEGSSTSRRSLMRLGNEADAIELFLDGRMVVCGARVGLLQSNASAPVATATTVSVLCWWDSTSHRVHLSIRANGGQLLAVAQERVATMRDFTPNELRVGAQGPIGQDANAFGGALDIMVVFLKRLSRDEVVAVGDMLVNFDACSGQSELLAKCGGAPSQLNNEDTYRIGATELTEPVPASSGGTVNYRVMGSNRVSDGPGLTWAEAELACLDAGASRLAAPASAEQKAALDSVMIEAMLSDGDGQEATSAISACRANASYAVHPQLKSRCGSFCDLHVQYPDIYSAAVASTRLSDPSACGEMCADISECLCAEFSYGQNGQEGLCSLKAFACESEELQLEYSPSTTNPVDVLQPCSGEQCCQHNWQPLFWIGGVRTGLSGSACQGPDSNNGKWPYWSTADLTADPALSPLTSIVQDVQCGRERLLDWGWRANVKRVDGDTGVLTEAEVQPWRSSGSNPAKFWMGFREAPPQTPQPSGWLGYRLLSPEGQNRNAGYYQNCTAARSLLREHVKADALTPAGALPEGVEEARWMDLGCTNVRLQRWVCEFPCEDCGRPRMPRAEPVPAGIAPLPHSAPAVQPRRPERIYLPIIGITVGCLLIATTVFMLLCLRHMYAARRSLEFGFSGDVKCVDNDDSGGHQKHDSQTAGLHSMAPIMHVDSREYLATELGGAVHALPAYGLHSVPMSDTESSYDSSSMSGAGSEMPRESDEALLSPPSSTHAGSLSLQNMTDTAVKSPVTTEPSQMKDSSVFTARSARSEFTARSGNIAVPSSLEMDESGMALARHYGTTSTVHRGHTPLAQYQPPGIEKHHISSSDWDSRRKDIHRLLDSYPSQTYIYGDYMLANELPRKDGSQGVVAFVRQEESNAVYAMKVFCARSAFDAEASVYKTVELAQVLPSVHALEGNEAESLVAPCGLVLPPFIIMDRGEPFDAWCARAQPDFVTALQVLMHAGRKLADLHSAGYAHRDVKPCNVIWNSRVNSWELIDFATAAPIGSYEPITCTVTYAAPEIILAVDASQKELEVNGKVDVWALGMMAWAMLVGESPWAPLLCQLGDRANEERVVLRKVYLQLLGRSKFPWEQTELVDEVHAQLGFLEDSVLAMLSRNPRKRPSMDALLAQWHGLLASPRSSCLPPHKVMRNTSINSTASAGGGTQNRLIPARVGVTGESESSASPDWPRSGRSTEAGHRARNRTSRRQASLRGMATQVPGDPDMSMETRRDGARRLVANQATDGSSMSEASRMMSTNMSTANTARVLRVHQAAPASRTRPDTAGPYAAQSVPCSTSNAGEETSGALDSAGQSSLQRMEPSSWTLSLDSRPQALVPDSVSTGMDTLQSTMSGAAATQRRRSRSPAGASDGAGQDSVSGALDASQFGGSDGQEAAGAQPPWNAHGRPHSGQTRDPSPQAQHRATSTMTDAPQSKPPRHSGLQDPGDTKRRDRPAVGTIDAGASPAQAPKVARTGASAAASPLNVILSSGILSSGPLRSGGSTGSGSMRMHGNVYTKRSMDALVRAHSDEFGVLESLDDPLEPLKSPVHSGSEFEPTRSVLAAVGGLRRPVATTSRRTAPSHASHLQSFHTPAGSPSHPAAGAARDIEITDDTQTYFSAIGADTFESGSAMQSHADSAYDQSTRFTAAVDDAGGPTALALDDMYITTLPDDDVDSAARDTLQATLPTTTVAAEITSGYESADSHGGHVSAGDAVAPAAPSLLAPLAASNPAAATLNEAHRVLIRSLHEDARAVISRAAARQLASSNCGVLTPAPQAQEGRESIPSAGAQASAPSAGRDYSTGTPVAQSSARLLNALLESRREDSDSRDMPRCFLPLESSGSEALNSLAQHELTLHDGIQAATGRGGSHAGSRAGSRAASQALSQALSRANSRGSRGSLTGSKAGSGAGSGSKGGHSVGPGSVADACASTSAMDAAADASGEGAGADISSHNSHLPVSEGPVTLADAVNTTCVLRSPLAGLEAQGLLGASRSSPPKAPVAHSGQQAARDTRQHHPAAQHSDVSAADPQQSRETSPQRPCGVPPLDLRKVRLAQRWNAAWHLGADVQKPCSGPSSLAAMWGANRTLYDREDDTAQEPLNSSSEPNRSGPSSRQLRSVRSLSPASAAPVIMSTGSSQGGAVSDPESQSRWRRVQDPVSGGRVWTMDSDRPAGSGSCSMPFH